MHAQLTHSSDLSIREQGLCRSVVKYSTTIRGNDLNHRVHVNVLNLARYRRTSVHASWSPSSLWESRLANEATIHRSLHIVSIAMRSNVYIHVLGSRLNPFPIRFLLLHVYIRRDKKIYRVNVFNHFPNIII